MIRSRFLLLLALCESLKDQLATIKKLLALAVHPGTPPEEAALANAKAEVMTKLFRVHLVTGKLGYPNPIINRSFGRELCQR